MGPVSHSRGFPSFPCTEDSYFEDDGAKDFARLLSGPETCSRSLSSHDSSKSSASDEVAEWPEAPSVARSMGCQSSIASNYWRSERHDRKDGLALIDEQCVALLTWGLPIIVFSW